MKFDEYIKLASVTCKPLPLPDHIVHMSMGLLGEIGELIDIQKKVCIYGKDLSDPAVLHAHRAHLTEEVGDTLWYFANLWSALEIPGEAYDLVLDDIAMAAMPEATPLEVGLGLVGISTTVANCVCELMPMSMAEDFPEFISAAPAVLAPIGIALAAAARVLNVDVYDAMDKNIAKLKVRYGDKFSEHAALNRDLGAERVVLEAPASAQ